MSLSNQVIGLVLFLALGLVFCWFLGCGGWVWSVSLLGYVFRDMTFDFVFGDLSFACLLMLLCCGSIALFYCYHYFSGSDSSSLLYPLMVGFLGVMGFLVVSGNFLFSLMFWEFLGLVSFFLILFYSNSSSARASLITLFASRFGDVGLFFIIMVSLTWMEISGVVFLIFLLMVVLTKSACYPFVSWLLEAMRAPTPVSSLVHSSTLVAAGVWFLFCYGYSFGSGVMSFLFVLSMVTVLVSGLSALFFNDLKKLVALSTCNNVSWCIIFFICGDLELALVQLLTHGVCKCYLFMTVGDLMSQSGGSQSSVGVYLTRYSGVLLVYLQSFLILSLCGLPFLGVFFSKHYLFSEVFYVFGWGYISFLLVGIFLSYAYSFRFVLLLLKSSGGLSLGYSSCFVLISLLSVLGSVINYLGSEGLVEYSPLSGLGSALLLFLQIMGCLSGWLVFLFVGGVGSNDLVNVFSSLVYSDSVVKGVYNVYIPLSGFSFVSFYRWEVYLLGLWPSFIGLFNFICRSFFSFNILVFSLLIFLLTGLFFFN